MKLSICGLQTYMLFSYGADVKNASQPKLLFIFRADCKIKPNNLHKKTAEALMVIV